MLWEGANGTHCLGSDVIMMNFNASSSICRNAASPSEAKISGMLRPSFSTITSSRSIKGQQSSCESLLPTLLLPHPINPVNDIIIYRLYYLRCVPIVWKRHLRTPAQWEGPLEYLGTIVPFFRTMSAVHHRPECPDRSDPQHLCYRSLLPDSLPPKLPAGRHPPACAAAR